ncbi:hypothetical protein pneo_cds_880 [Pandoravirus neocaledonia]|uniref:Ankyrin repeat domain containing protein n=1 Tax=Pandoravirus neocaledonia TaxID=2107708 RepID=A0A2U7UDH9_9VIRU|nr:hypothetical protein pneo_cds_880 [Pandoravirus neocaledonia]AVK76487.1 hypothetical protein pneo_cds_880 [Pandoravirus neocaledonia]
MNDVEYMDVQYADEGTPGLESLPPEIVEMILASAGPFATARAAQASRYVAETARQLARIETQQTINELCPDYLTCLQEFMLAAADDDVPTVEYILASGVIGPRQSLIRSDVQLPRAPLGRNQVDAYSLLRTAPPTYEGWTPLTVAAAYGSPAVVALLASISVHPRTGVEALINGLVLRARRLDSWNPLVRGVRALTQSYPRTVPLAPPDANPLTVVRHEGAERASRAARSDLFSAHDTDSARRVFETDVYPIVEALMRAGYDPSERTYDGRGPEALAAAEELNALQQEADRDERLTGLRLLSTMTWAKALMTEAILDAYAQGSAMQ